MSDFYWTYMIDGKVNDSTYESKELAENDANEEFYYECIGDDLLFNLERGVEFVKCRDTYFGDRVILEIVKDKVSFDREEFINKNFHPDLPSICHI